MEPWRHEDKGKWETVKGPKKRPTKEEARKGKKVVGASSTQPSPAISYLPTGAGGVIDPSASAFTALDEWEKRRAAAQGLNPPPVDSDSDSDSDADGGGFSTVRRKKGKAAARNDVGALGNGSGTNGAVDGAFGWSNVAIPGQALPKKPKQPRAPRPSVAECGAKLDAGHLRTYLAHLEREYPGMNHLVFFGDYFRRAFEKADAVALNKLVTSTPIGIAGEQPVCHVPRPVVALATQWAAKRDFAQVSAYVASTVSDLCAPEPSSSSSAGRGSSSSKAAASSSKAGAAAGPARPSAGVLVTVALLLRAVPGALNPPEALPREKHPRLTRPDCAPILAWVTAQAAAGNAASGLGLWTRAMMPAAIEAAGKKGAYGSGKATEAERAETIRLASAIAEALTGTAAAKRRLNGHAPAMSATLGVAPSAVDLLLRADPAVVPAAVMNMLPVMIDVCRAPNAPSRAADVAALTWPLATAQAASRRDEVKTAGVDALVWCVAALDDNNLRHLLPELCASHPGVGRDVVKGVADVLEGKVGAGAGGKVKLTGKQKHKVLRETAAEIREVARGGGGKGDWAGLNAQARRVQRVVGMPKGKSSGSFADVFNTLLVAAFFLVSIVFVIALAVSYMATPEGGWALDAVSSMVPDDRAKVVTETVHSVATEIQGMRAALLRSFVSSVA